MGGIDQKGDAGDPTCKALPSGPPDEAAVALNALLAGHHNENRSSAIRDLPRYVVGQRNPAWPCIAAVSRLCDHHERELSRRLTEAPPRPRGMRLGGINIMPAPQASRPPAKTPARHLPHPGQQP